MTNDLSTAGRARRAAGAAFRRAVPVAAPRTTAGAAGRGLIVLGAAAGLAAAAYAGATAGGGPKAGSGATAAGAATAAPGAWLAVPLAPSPAAADAPAAAGAGTGRRIAARAVPAASSRMPSAAGPVVAPAPTGGRGGSAPAGTGPSPGAAGTEAVTAGTMQTSPSGTACGGQPTVVSDGVTWTCSFDSEFTGTSLDPTQWQPITTAGSGYLSGPNACYVDDPANISVGNGYLSLTARKTAQPFACQLPGGVSFTTQYTSGTVASYQRFSQAYGRFEVIAKVPSTSVPGLQSSFWLYPESLDGYGPWPASGEIDIAEIYSQYAELGVPFLHYYTNGYTSAATDTNVVTNDTCTIDVGHFNDYVLEWTPTTMRMIYNGTTCLVDHWVPASTQSAPEPFNQPFFINLTQALGIGTNQFDPSATPLPATTEIKAVRVWRIAPGS